MSNGKKWTKSAVGSTRYQPGMILHTPALISQGFSKKNVNRINMGSGAADKAAVWQVSVGECRHKSCRVNCSVRTRSDTGTRNR